MTQQSINIINFKTLYEILNEIKENFSFKIINYHDEKIFFQSLENKDLNISESIILVHPKNKKMLDSKKLSKDIFYVVDNLPTNIIKLIENINVKLIRRKYVNQSNLDIKDYNVNLNSRVITKDSIHLRLTEKEIDIILFLNENEGPQNINVLQSKVWGYSSELETHTVETHIYRLRKKIKDLFKDENFILSKDSGYLIR